MIPPLDERTRQGIMQTARARRTRDQETGRVVIDLSETRYTHHEVLGAFADLVRIGQEKFGGDRTNVDDER